MKSIYMQIMDGETLRVRFKVQGEGWHKGPFQVGPLWMIDDYYVPEQSEWKPFARVGGVVINGQRRERMEREDLQSWCNELEVIA